MSTTDGMTQASAATALGFTKGLAVQELGWDDDVDEALRDAIMDAIDGDLLYESNEAVDVVLLWWRDSDGDVADGLVDALTDLSPTGYIWLLTPKVGRPDYVDPTDLAEGEHAVEVRAFDRWQGERSARTSYRLQVAEP